jgi:hypothetical protein
MRADVVNRATNATRKYLVIEQDGLIQLEASE